jgi:hypothetical protein
MPEKEDKAHYSFSFIKACTLSSDLEHKEHGITNPAMGLVEYCSVSPWLKAHKVTANNAGVVFRGT